MQLYGWIIPYTWFPSKCVTSAKLNTKDWNWNYKIEIKVPNINGLVVTTAFKTKATNIEDKILDINDFIDIP